ncbi:MAG TPA: hypothetical protein VIX19_06430 [Terriglobales bacterium]
MNPRTLEIVVEIACSIFAAGTLVFIFLPSRDAEVGVDKTRVEYLYERKEVIYENLRDLNFEYKSGKFSQADYDGMRFAMEAEAARLLAEIDRLETARN